MDSSSPFSQQTFFSNLLGPLVQSDFGRCSLRVLLQGSLGLYGVEVFVNSLGYYLRQMEIDVAIEPPLGRFLIRKGVQRTSGMYGFGEQHVSKKPLASIDLIHLNYALVSLPLLFRLPPGKPVLYTVHGVPQPHLEQEPRFKIGYTLEMMSLKYVANRVTKVVAISKYVQTLLKRNFGIPSDVIYNGVDTELFHPISAKEKLAKRDDLSISKAAKVVLFVGRLYPYKDPFTLIRCIPKVIAKNPNVVFTIIGNGPLTEKISSEVSRLDLRSRVRVIPFLRRSELVEWFQVADAFVSTSPTEMLGFSVIEAMSCGVPVIAAGSGGPVEVLGSAGTFFVPYDQDDLADKVISVVEDEDQKSRLGRAGRETVLRRFRWEDISRSYANAYDEAISLR